MGEASNELGMHLHHRTIFASSADTKMRKSAEEAEGLRRLHELSGRLATTIGLQPLLEEILDATLKMIGADFGDVQLYDPKSGALKIVAQQGFQQEFLDYFDALSAATAPCGLALQRRERVVVED